MQGPAQAATPAEIAELSEAEARALFSRFRFRETGGEPYCAECGCDALYFISTRHRWRCKGCEKTFSLTSGTAFAYRKLPFKAILSILAEFNIAYQGRSALEIRRNLRRIKGYKTIFVWLHKIRCALKRAEQAIKLRGEVEIDGKEVGGHIRPANMRKDDNERKNFYSFPFRASDRKMKVTLGRERDGPARAWVGKEEHHAIVPFGAALLPNTIIYSDAEPNWTDLRDHGRLRQISHKQGFYTPTACTNVVESGFRVLGGMEMIFRHIIGNYLDLYAAQLAWRLTRSRMSDDEGLASIMQAMLTTGRSEMAGYFLPKKDGGVKRKCQIIKEDGSHGQWSPPTREERKQAREAARRKQNRPPTPRLADARSDRWNEDFDFVSAADFLTNPKTVPNSPSVYCILLRGGSELMAQAGYFPDPRMPTWEVDRHLHIYTGESYGIRDRLAQHLAGNIKDSGMRESILAIQWLASSPPNGLSDFNGRETTEAALTEWLKTEATIAFKTCHYTRQAQNAIIARTATPLNISDRAATPFSRLLQTLSNAFASLSSPAGLLRCQKFESSPGASRLGSTACAT